ncbi:MAG: hypothetical protein ACREBR_04405 [bacterium]
MRNTQTLDEARKYLLYVSDALHAMASSYSFDKEERAVLAKYASDIFDYSKGLEQLKSSVVAKDQAAKKLQIIAELESTYDVRKRASVKAHENVRIVTARLKQVEKEGNKAEIEEWKRRLAHYKNQNLIAQQNEFVAKREFEQGA